MSYIGIPPFGNTVRSVTNVTATASQTTFNITGGYVIGYVDVFLNGVLLTPSDYTATDGLTVVLNTGASASDEFQAVSYQPVSIANVLPSTGGTVSGDVTIASGNTLKTNTILDASGGNTVTINSVTPTAYNTMGKNLIINGAMQIDQRGSASSAIASAGGRVYSVDRFAMGKYGGSTAGFNGQQVSVTGAGSFDKALKCTVTSAVSPSGDQANLIAYLIEGQDWERLQYKTADAKTITISFWVRSSVTGTYCVAITDSTNSIGYAAEYTINTADTFEFKTITISGYTGASGTWNTYNNTGAAIAWGLGGAGARLITGNTWTSTSATPIGTSNQTNWVATSGATFYITGVQLEVGSVATEFERRPYGTELALCQRYYEKSYNIGTVPGTSTTTGIAGYIVMASTTTSLANNGTNAVVFKVYKRTTPTITTYDSVGNSGKLSYAPAGIGRQDNITSVVHRQAEGGFGVYTTSASSLTTGQAVEQFHQWTAAAEL